MQESGARERQREAVWRAEGAGMTRLGALLKRYRVVLGYLTVAVVSAVAVRILFPLEPRFEAWLAVRGYEMASPEWLALVGLAPFFWFVRLHTLTDMPFLQQMVSATLRSAMVVALALALTQPTAVSEEPVKTATVMVVDVSDSVREEALTAARDQLQALWDGRGDNTVRLVTFASTARVVPLLAGPQGELAPIARHADGGLGTDLQQALRLAYGLFLPGRKKRLVLVTDGLETRGNAQNELETAVRLGIRVYYRSYPEGAPRPELMVTSIDVPTEIEQNVPFDVGVTVVTNRAGLVACTLTVDKLVAGQREAALERGEKTLDFDEVRVREGGEHGFEVRCEPKLWDGATEAAKRAADRVASNNHFGANRFVREKKRILYVEGEAMYSRNFRDALADDFDVEVRGAGGIPRTLKEMQRFKAIVVSDVPRQNAYYRENMTSRQMRLLGEYAKGGGFLLFTGGQDSLGPGGYGDTYLERRVLPVKLDVEHELDTPRLALVLVIDRSGSMNGRKLELAKKAARATVAALDKRDRVGVVAFDSGAQRLIKMTRASSKARFDRALRRLTAGGGTAIYPALDEAFDMLRGVDAKVKHVILMTDGESKRTSVGNLVAEGVRRGITVSTIAVGAGSARALLESIARMGNGRHYYTESAEAIPRLFVDETREVAGESMVEEPFRPTLTRRARGLRFLKGLNLRRAPRLYGYVPTRAKRGAEVILTTPKGDPLLVRVKRGKGWVTVWTSDIKNKWARRWLRWSGFAPFWRQMLKDGIHEEERKRHFPIEVRVARHELWISTDAVDEAENFISGVSAKATVTDPSGKRREVTLRQTAPGRYEARVPAPEYGPYQVDVTHTKGDVKLATSRGRATYPYPEENLRFEPDLGRVAALSRATGGGRDPDVARLLDAGGEVLTHRRPVWHWFVVLVLAAIVLDVLLRRVRLWRAPSGRLGRV